MNILFSDDEYVFDRESEAKHNQVSICSIEAMSIVLTELSLVCPHKLHNFVFSLSWSIWPCKYNAQSFPIIILIYLFLNEKMKHLIELLHESSSWWNWVIFEVLLTICDISITVEFSNVLFVLFSRSKSSRTLVVHLASWGNTIKSHHYHFSWLDHVDKSIDIVEYFDPYFLKLFRHELGFENNGVILNELEVTRTHL